MPFWRVRILSFKLYHWSKFKLRQISRCHVCSCITPVNWVLNRIPVEVAHWYFVYKGKKKKPVPSPPSQKKPHPSQANRNSIENLCMIQKCVIIQRFMTPLLYWLLCILLNTDKSLSCIKPIPTFINCSFREFLN